MSSSEVSWLYHTLGWACNARSYSRQPPPIDITRYRYYPLSISPVININRYRYCYITVLISPLLLLQITAAAITIITTDHYLSSNIIPGKIYEDVCLFSFVKADAVTDIIVITIYSINRLVAGLADRHCPVPGNLLDSRICPWRQIINQSYTLPINDMSILWQ